MESRENAKMKVSLNRSRVPTFVLIVLVSLLCIVTYNYWSISSSNKELLQKLRLVESAKMVTEQKHSALESKIVNMENENRLLENDLLNDRAVKEEALSVTSDIKVKVDQLRKDLDIAIYKEKVYHKELETLKSGVNGSSSQLKIVSQKAEKLLKKFKDVKANHSALLEKLTKITAERDLCQKDLKKRTLELEDAKDAAAAKKVSNKTKPKSEVTDDKESNKLMQEGKEVSDESENEKPDEDEATMGSEEEEQEEEESDGKELADKKAKPSIVKPDLSEEKQTPLSPKSAKADKNKSQSTIKPTSQTTGATISKEREKRDEESDEQKLADTKDVEDEDTAGKLIQSKEEAVAKESEMEKKEGVNDEKGDDESEDTLDDEEKVQKSLNLHVDDRIQEDPAKQGYEEKPRGYKYISNLSKEKLLKVRDQQNLPGHLHNDYVGQEN